MVKQKLKPSGKYIGSSGIKLHGFLVGLALLTFILSSLPSLPAPFIERWFSRFLYPRISFLSGRVADSVSFAWLDLLLILTILYIAVCIYRRRLLPILGVAAFGYLLFFWSWGLNYRRQPLASKLAVDVSAGSATAMDAFSRHVAEQLNSLYTEAGRGSYREDRIRDEASARVARVVEVLDGTRWTAAHRIKTSVIADPWFRAAGIDGVFDPIIHEPIVNSTLLDVERPFVIAHELAHVRGYPNEGDANLVAVLATLLSDDPRLQYSGWMQLWFYVKTPPLDALLEPGPRQDVQRIVARYRSEGIPWISNFQYAVLDLFLKANNVPEGVKSYAEVVLLAAETEKSWERFR